jgi:hypothetical protein
LKAFKSESLGHSGIAGATDFAFAASSTTSATGSACFSQPELTDYDYQAAAIVFPAWYLNYSIEIPIPNCLY